jgi:small Trp-rich protein
MWFVVIGVILILLKWAEVGPFAEWSWWVALAPFPCAIGWWAWADMTGYTKRKEMEKMEERKKERREKNMVALGTQQRKRR